jgi:hypothetical protein
MPPLRDRWLYIYPFQVGCVHTIIYVQIFLPSWEGYIYNVQWIQGLSNYKELVALCSWAPYR